MSEAERKYTYIKEESELLPIIPKLMASPVWGIDTETTGLDCHKDRVTLLQIGNIESQFVIDTRKVNIEPLRPFLESESHKKVGHNLKFDYKMIKGSFGIEMENMRDTFLAEKILNVGRKAYGYALDDTLKTHLSIEVDKSLQKSFIGHKGDYSEAQLRYAANDVAYLVELIRKQSVHIQQDGLGFTFLLECGALPCFGDMEFKGLLLDKDKWGEILKKNVALALDYQKQMEEIIRPIWKTDLFGNVDINFSSTPQVVEVLQRMKVSIPERDPKTGEFVDVVVRNSSNQSLKKAKDHPFVALLKKYRSAMKMVGTYGQNFIDAIHPVTGRIHPELNQIGTETGRPASNDNSPINPLNVPRSKEMRQSFIAEEDWLIETDDYSGCELRIWAEISGDPGLREPLLKGEDLHCAVATKLYRVPVTKDNENASLRTPAKNLNFGIAYGMGVPKLYEDVNAADFPMTFEEAKELYRRYTKEEFKVGVDFLRNAGKQALEQGYLANISGRRRYWLKPDPNNRERFPRGRDDDAYRGVCASIEREGGNCLIQSVNADMTKDAMIGIRKHVKKNRVRSHIINQVYDEIVTTTHKDDSPDFWKVKQKIMVESAQKFLKEVPMVVEGHVLPYWTK